MEKINLKKVDDVIFISDIHFGVYSASTEWNENIVGYFREFFFPLVRKEITEGHSPAIVVAGDFFHNRQHLDLDVLNRAIRIVTEMAEICPVYFIVGNHDMYKEKETDVTSIVVFENIKNVRIVYESAILTTKGGTRYMLVSWMGDRAQESKFIAKNKDKFDYAVMHTEVAGMKYDNNRPIVNGINVAVLDDNCRIIAGHIHKRQTSAKALYLGSPYMMTRSDIGNEKGIYCFRDTEGGSVIPEFIQNDYSPKFVALRYSEYGKDFGKWEPAVRNNYVDVILTSEEADKINTDVLSKELRKFAPKKIEFVSVSKPSATTEVKYDNDMSIADIFEARVSEDGLSEDDYENLVQINLDYIKRATELL